MSYLNIKFKLTVFQIMMLGYLVIILVGAILLTTPMASATGTPTHFLDALFTSTSAVCVTGLVVHDTATFWSMFGQAVILILIQIGGMGFITIIMAISVMTGRRIGLTQRSAMQEAISAPQIGGMVRLTGFIISTTFALELAGAAILYTTFGRQFGKLRGIWYSIFHSVSAFCNAGFDLMGGRGEYSSLTSFRSNPVVCITIMLLIIIGGIGFLTWADIRDNGLHYRAYRLQTHTILFYTAILIAVPALIFFVTEFKELPLGERVLTSLFQSVTPRTAGFNTADYTQMSDNGIAMTIVLMLIGGAPGSTAGGMKVTTIAVLVAMNFAVFKRNQNAAMFSRRVADESIRHASTICGLYIVLFLLGGMVISSLEQIPLQKCLFETASAAGTVGLTLGITPTLGSWSRIILIMLMFFGRVGGLTLIFATIQKHNHGNARLPLGHITVG